MSEDVRTTYYLCDCCAKKLDGDHMNTCVCIPTFPSEHFKRHMDGRRDPLDVCRHYAARTTDCSACAGASSTRRRGND